MFSYRWLPGLFLVSTSALLAQTDARQIAPRMEREIQHPEVSAFRLRQYLLKKIPPLPRAGSASEWTSRAQATRRRLLDEVVFHGWPKQWVDAPPRFEDAGEIPAGQGYRMRKLRYEIVPGFWSAAILYLPDPLPGKAPAIVNVNGHVGPPGKAVEYKQKRCINQAKQGIINLNLEWFNFGELAGKENGHWMAAHLDLVGASGLGLFYLEMRKGLDYLAQHPNVDRGRLGVTGLSGGGWQTIILSALDDRVAVSVPVAGFMSLVSRVLPHGEVGDIEQSPADLLGIADFPELIAMRSPKPTLLAYNAEDSCCFRGPVVKSRLYDDVLPFYRLFGKTDALAWHENLDPSDHNYQLDNRVQSYKFFTKHFGLPVANGEIPAGQEIKSYDELVVGLPKDNLTILGLAKQFARDAQRPPVADAAREREELKKVVRLNEVGVANAFPLWNTKRKEVETLSYLLEFSNGLSATALWVKAIAAPSPAPATIVLNDKGKKEAGAEISERVNRDEQVLGLDLLLFGESAPAAPGIWGFSEFLSTVGDRPLGLESAQLIATAKWLAARSPSRKVRLESTGFRSQVIAMTAAALAPDLFSEIAVRQGAKSLQIVLDAPINYLDAPDLFCPDLYRRFDLDQLRQLAGSTRYTGLP